MKLSLFTLIILFLISCEKRDSDPNDGTATQGNANDSSVNPLAYERALEGTYVMSARKIHHFYQSGTYDTTFYNDTAEITKIGDSVLLVTTSSMSKELRLYSITDSLADYTNSYSSNPGNVAWFTYVFGNDSIYISDRNGGIQTVHDYYNYWGKK